MAGWRQSKALLVSLGYLLLCAVLAAGLAYPLYQLMQETAGLRVLVTRGSLVLVIVGLGFWCRFLHLGRHEILGFAAGNRNWASLLTGFALGSLMLGLHSSVMVWLDIRSLDMAMWQKTGWLLKGLAQALGVGLLVALIEEILFRGVLLAALRQVAGTLTAVVLSSVYYAVLHFFRVDPRTLYPEPDAWSGFVVLRDALAHIAGAPFDSLLALFCAGLFLSLVRLGRTNGMLYCVGLHAGWVFIIKFSKTLTDPTPPGPWSFLVGSYDGYTGYLAAGWMGLLSLLLGGWLYWRGGENHRVS